MLWLLLGLLFLSFTRPRPTTHDQAIAVEVTAGELTNWVSGDRLPVLCHRWAVVAGRIRPRSVHERGVDQRLSCLHAMKRGLEYSRRTFIVFCLGLGRPSLSGRTGHAQTFFQRNYYIVVWGSAASPDHAGAATRPFHLVDLASGFRGCSAIRRHIYTLAPLWRCPLLNRR